MRNVWRILCRFCNRRVSFFVRMLVDTSTTFGVVYHRNVVLSTFLCQRFV